MNKDFQSRFINYIMNFIVALGLSFSLIYAFTSTFKMNYGTVEIFIGTFITLMIYSILFTNNLSFKIFTVISALILVFITIYFLKNPLEFKILIKRLISLVKLIDNQIAGRVVINEKYQKFIVRGLTIIFSLFIYIFSVKKFNFYILLVVGANVFAGQWMTKYFVIYFSFYIFLFFILISYLKYIYLRSIKKSKYESKTIPISFLLYSVITCVTVFSLAYYLSDKDKTIEFSLIRNNNKNVTRSINKIFNNVNDSYFNIKYTGFSEDGSKLGGNVSIDNTIVMKVKSPEGGIYLKGAVRDRYTGYSWESSKTRLTSLDSVKKLNNFNEDLEELIKGSKVISNEADVLDSSFEKKSIKITYKDLNTRTIFTPSKVENLVFESEENLGVNIDFYGMLSSKNSLKKNFEYTAEFYKIDGNGEDIYDLLRSSSKGLYSRYLKNNFVGSLGNQGFNEYVMSLAEKSNDFYVKYLQLPDSMPERVKNLAFEITSLENNDYDKAKAIEEYLSKNYEYTLKPGSTPENREFVDYFLFDLKKGYCTYYASAMTVLARSIGIPARYVEGYVLPQEASANGEYKVKNKQAHAWVEVYFEGFGWMTFEPTSPFSEYLEEEVQEQNFNVEDNESEIVQSNNINKENQSMNNILEEESKVNLNDKKDKENKSIIIIIFSIVISTFLLLYIITFPYIKRKIMIYKLKKDPSKNRIIKMYKRFLRIFSVKELKIKSGETPIQYAERIDEILGFNEITFRRITDIFNKSIYSSRDITIEEVQLIIDFYYIIPAYYKKKLGRVEYILYFYNFI